MSDEVKKPTRRRAAPPQPAEGQHHWIGAAYVDIPLNLIRRASHRGRIDLEKLQVQILEVYCRDCRRKYDNSVIEEKCPARAKDKDHLIGGPVAERRRRAVDDADVPQGAR